MGIFERLVVLRMLLDPLIGLGSEALDIMEQSRQLQSALCSGLEP
jgi:hypothetical protein